MSNIRDKSASRNLTTQNLKQAITSQAVTANRLSDGSVVYLTDRDNWSDQITDCRTVDDKSAADDLLHRAAHRAADDLVVGPYLFKVATENGQTVPIGQREIIRTTGPTVGTDLNLG